MNETREFHYRLPGRAGGFRPGSHPGTSFGAGQQFALHARLADHPDPRRVDLRASLQSVRGEWLVRLHLQRVAVPVHVVVDVSASMCFGKRRSKLEVVADFVAALGYSAFRSGDRAGMTAFDAQAREDLFVSPRHGRGSGDMMAAMLRAEAVLSRTRGANGRRSGHGNASGINGLARAVEPLAAKQALVFIVSDFHWPLDGLPAVLDTLAHASVVPIVVWDEAELAPPPHGSLLAVHDAETGAQRTIWLSPRVRHQWEAAVSRRREELGSLFGVRGLRPFEIAGAFDADALSRYFIEGTA
ncbi:MAG: DUF58 domain-containing protein [Paraburkholderia sp.]|nr:MAG: DUF58 domain-containing protein [Paraburkholderia sp.]